MKNKMRSIVEGSIVKRILALIMDAAVFFFLWGALAAFVFSPIADKGMHYSDIGAKAADLEVKSQLYVPVEKDEDGNQIIIDVDNYEGDGSGEFDFIVLYEYKSNDINFYKDRLKYYYLNFKTGVGVICPEGKNIEDYKAPNYKELIKDENGNDVEPALYYTESWFDSKFGAIADVEEFKTGAVYDAVKDFYFQPYFNELNNKMKAIQIFIIIPPYLLSFGLFFILIPVLYKNGETLGKKVVHLGFVTKDCYDIKKRQILLRQILLLICVSVCTFIIGIGWTSVATLGLGVFIYFIATFISKTKRSPADYFAFTYLIDTQLSVWFHDAKEEEAKEQELSEKMESYQKYVPEQKNVIQVGTEIVDEQVRKEFEEEKLKNK